MPLARRPLRRLLPALLLACLSSHALADQGSTLEERMSYKEFTGYGLDKLSPEQLKGLNAWLQAHGPTAACGPAAAAAPAPVAAPAATAGGDAQPPPPPQRPVRDKVTSRIVGAFSGWKYGQVLVLANGQRWEVRDEEPFITSTEQQPRVTVEPSFLSGWILTVEGHSEIAHVVPASKR